MKSASGKLTEQNCEHIGLWAVSGGMLLVASGCWMLYWKLPSCGLESEQIGASLINATALFMCPAEVCLFGALHKVKLN